MPDPKPTTVFISALRQFLAKEKMDENVASCDFDDGFNAGIDAVSRFLDRAEREGRG